MMPTHISVRISRKGEVKKAVSSLMTHVRKGEWNRGVLSLRRLEDALQQHFATRGEGTDRYNGRLDKIRYYLSSDVRSTYRKKYAMEHITKLIRGLSIFPQPDDSGLRLLSLISAELREDWQTFWEDPDMENLGAIFDDLNRLEEIEPNMRGESNDIYKQYRRILETKGELQTNWPIMQALTVPGRTGNEGQRRMVYDSFSKLFSQIDSLKAPEKYEFKETEEEVPEELMEAV